MKKIVALIAFAFIINYANAQTSGQRSTPPKIESNSTKPSSGNTGKEGEVKEPTNTGKPIEGTKDTSTQKEKGKGKDKAKHENGSYHSNERSKEKSNNGNHYGQLKDKKKN